MAQLTGGSCSKYFSYFLWMRTTHPEHEMKIKSCSVVKSSGDLGWGFFPEVIYVCQACGEKGGAYIVGLEILRAHYNI